MKTRNWISAILFSFSIGVFTGGTLKVLDWQRKAVEAGHAEYYLDKDNNKQWRWK